MLVVRTDRHGDFSTYTPALVASRAARRQPPAGFDPRLVRGRRSPSRSSARATSTAKPSTVCPEPALQAPQIDYLAKDYASFRRLMLDRLASVMPDWSERNPADLGVTLVELLAYAGDQLATSQDAVATEAYLGTARRRVSVRRHARLVDYAMHDGCNARAWVCFEVAERGAADGASLPAGTRVLTRALNAPPPCRRINWMMCSRTNPVVFETLHEVTLAHRRNAIAFYTWGDPTCCLPQGRRGHPRGSAAESGSGRGRRAGLRGGAGPESGRPEDADPTHRHAVRLSSRRRRARPTARPARRCSRSSWDDEDALAVPALPQGVRRRVGRTCRGASVARGNVVLADHGLTVLEGDASCAPRQRARATALPSGAAAHLALTHAVPYDDRAARAQSGGRGRTLRPAHVRAARSSCWRGIDDVDCPQRDLLGTATASPRDFVVEIEDDGRARLRFGDGVLGRRPRPARRSGATYRVGQRGGRQRRRRGDGAAGHLPIAASARCATRCRRAAASTRSRSSRSGCYAPQAFRRRSARSPPPTTPRPRSAIPTCSARRRRGAGPAAGTRVFVTVDRAAATPVDAAFEERPARVPRALPHGRPRPRDRRAALRAARHRAERLRRGRLLPRPTSAARCSTRSAPAICRTAAGASSTPTTSRSASRSSSARSSPRPCDVPGCRLSVRASTRFQRWGEDPHGELDDGRIDMRPAGDRPAGQRSQRAGERSHRVLTMSGWAMSETRDSTAAAASLWPMPVPIVATVRACRRWPYRIGTHAAFLRAHASRAFGARRRRGRAERPQVRSRP